MILSIERTIIENYNDLNNILNANIISISYPIMCLKTYCIFVFKVIARQTDSPPGKGASAPVALSVHLNNVNDNSPVIKPLPTVRLPAGDGIRTVAKVRNTHYLNVR